MELTVRVIGSIWTHYLKDAHIEEEEEEAQLEDSNLNWNSSDER